MVKRSRKGNVKRFWVTIVIVVGGVLLIAIGIIRSNLNFYMTIAELKGLDNARASKVRVIGEVAESSRASDGESGYNFILRDGDSQLRVHYRGVGGCVTGGREVVVEGILNDEGVFESDKIITRCESKYSAGSQGGTK